jgi:hypothetical protein
LNKTTGVDFNAIYAFSSAIDCKSNFKKGISNGLLEMKPIARNKSLIYLKLRKGLFNFFD